MLRISSRFHAALLGILACIMLAIALAALFSGGGPTAAVYFARLDAPAYSAPNGLNGNINVNTADLKELVRLPGVGDKIAAAIIMEREANGFFHYPEDLLSVKGIGEKKLKELMPRIRLDDLP